MNVPSPPPNYSEVLIVGGGPVGLITAYQLAKFSTSHPLSIRLIEKHSKSSQDAYGRAITLYPRSSELLDTLGLAEDLAQECFACRETVSYDATGKEVAGRGWSFMEKMGKREGEWTNWDFALVLRQRYQEEIFRRRLGELGLRVEEEIELVNVEVDESVQEGGYRVLATLRHVRTRKEEMVRCKYLVGADGGKSFVRRALGIEFEGTTSEDRWVRVDGVVDTDMPKNRGYGAIESPTHGNVLWAALDHGATRIGFAFTADRQKAYPEFNEAAAVAEAIESVKPFNLKFKQVDWWTIYSVGQRVAESFFTKGCVFLAGDACHTHSSGAAQGMNTGIHDACNLAWKLSLVLRGVAQLSILETYELERRPNVEKLINYDKDISRLMTMQLPLAWKGDPNADPNEILGYVMEEASAFTSGLSIAFGSNELNMSGSLASSLVGKRAPDAFVNKPGTNEITRLHTHIPNKACFHIILFTGDPKLTSTSFQEFIKSVETCRIFSELASQSLISWITIPAKASPSAFELLGAMPLGKLYYDERQIAHGRYGVEIDKGGVFVIRPDSWVGSAQTLNAHAAQELETYLRKVFGPLSELLTD